MAAVVEGSGVDPSPGTALGEQVVVPVAVVVRVGALVAVVSADDPLLGLLSTRDLQGSARLFFFVVVTRGGKSVVEEAEAGLDELPFVPKVHPVAEKCT